MIPFAPGFFKPFLAGGGPTGTHLFYFEDNLDDYFNNASNEDLYGYDLSATDKIFGTHSLRINNTLPTNTKYFAWDTIHSWPTIKAGFTWEGFIKNQPSGASWQSGYVPILFNYGGKIDAVENSLSIICYTGKMGVRLYTDQAGPYWFAFQDLAFAYPDWEDTTLRHWSFCGEGDDIWMSLGGVVQATTWTNLISVSGFPEILWPDDWAPYVDRYACGIYANAVSGTNYQTWGLVDNVRVTHGVARYKSNFTPPTSPYTD